MAANNDSTTATASTADQACLRLERLFDSLNHYFRSEDILAGSEHSTPSLGTAITLAYALVIAVGTIGNLLTIAAVVRNRQMRTVRNFFILNLALSDFFVSTVTAPLTLYTVLYVFWPYGSVSCKIVGSLQVKLNNLLLAESTEKFGLGLQGFNVFLSTFSIAAIALDRYVLVIFPTKRDRQHNLSLLFFSLIWLISILLALPLFAASDLKLLFEDPKCGISASICHEQNISWQQMPFSKELYTVAVLVIQYALPLASIAFVYSRIARRMGARLANRRNSPPPQPPSQQPARPANNSNSDAGSSCQPPASTMAIRGGSGVSIDDIRKMRSDRDRSSATMAAPMDESERRRKSLVDRHRRTNLLLTSIVCIFAVAWLPLNTFHLINTFGLVKSYSVPVFALCHIFAICSACLNPLSYAFFNHNFRTEFIAIFKRLGLIYLYEALTRHWLHLSSRDASQPSSADDRRRSGKARANHHRGAAQLSLAGNPHQRSGPASMFERVTEPADGRQMCRNGALQTTALLPTTNTFLEATTTGASLLCGGEETSKMADL